jgi:hypothetical protein
VKVAGDPHLIRPVPCEPDQARALYEVAGVLRRPARVAVHADGPECSCGADDCRHVRAVLLAGLCPAASWTIAGDPGPREG